eukprot:2439334-Prymnesium_polylepis.1
MACTRWLLKSARPITLPAERDVCRFVTSSTRSRVARGAPPSPSHFAVHDCILKLSGMGQVRVQRWFADMVIDGVISNLPWPATFGLMAAAR